MARTETTMTTTPDDAPSGVGDRHAAAESKGTRTAYGSYREAKYAAGAVRLSGTSRHAYAIYDGSLGAWCVQE